ncbi:MAG: hypothetical protein M4579_002184 [Chaenotheca gracillima]|nr:MAG: hypothetical protein M4579_002184 [Chaenotheca gracillima]
MAERVGRPISRIFQGPAAAPLDRSSSPAARLKKLPSQFLRNATPPPQTLTTPAPADEAQKRKSWFGRSRNASPEGGHWSWTRVNGARVPYDSTTLRTGRRVRRVMNPYTPLWTNEAYALRIAQVPDLWDDDGDTLIFLFPRIANNGPSFKLNSSLFASSTVLRQLVHGGHVDSDFAELTLDVPTPPLSDDEGQWRPPVTRPSKNRELAELYLPLKLSTDGMDHPMTHGEPKYSEEDVDKLINTRNLFAFLLGRPLVATIKYPTNFPIFMGIADSLEHYEFRNLDGSTFGEVASTSFLHYVRELRLADVRQSREKTLEGIILGERMRCLELYNEAFVHGVGKYDAIKKLDEGLFELITPITRKRLGRDSIDLENRLKSVRERLRDFDFPSVFAGFANSTSSSESRMIHFKEWKSAFLALRKHVMAFYKDQYGAWPPKASSKKNDFEESGLNRLVLRRLYHDFADLYDLLVDRTAPTTRSAGLHDQQVDDRADNPGSEEPKPRALRRVLGEYDHSTPPVQPPIPFDTPLLPSLAIIRPTYGTGDLKRDKKDRNKKLKNDELEKLRAGSHNPDTEPKATPFLLSFLNFERKAAAGSSLSELHDQRNGHWIFLYAVLQALPMLVIDAPGVSASEGVEYFLCQPPKGGAPWSARDSNNRKSWYGIAGGAGGVVNLPADVVDHGVEGVFRRSHCWLAAQKWTGTPFAPQPISYAQDPSAPLAPPPIFPGSAAWPDRPVSSAGSTGSSRHSVYQLGLEALPVPAGTTDPTLAAGIGAAGSRPGSRPVSRHDPTKRFEDILADVPGKGKGGKKNKK